jgi:hypothetical protein
MRRLRSTPSPRVLVTGALALLAPAALGCNGLLDKLRGGSGDAGAAASVVDAAPADTGPTLAEVIAKHKAAVEARKTKADAILEKLPPRLFADTLKAPSGAAPTIAQSGANTVIEYPDNDKQDLDSRVTDDDHLYTCHQILDGEKKIFNGHKDVPVTADMAETYLSRCEKYAYLLVVRSFTSTKPEMGGGGEFTPGAVDGDAILFDLSTGTSYGGVRFSAKNSAEFKAKAGDLDPVDENLQQNSLTALREAITKHIPAANVGTSTE